MKDNQVFTQQVRNNVLFNSLDDAFLGELLLHIQELHFPAGNVIFEDQAQGDAFYLIISGTVKITKRIESGNESVLGILHQGDFFGELELIDQRSRSANAVAMTDCTLGVLRKEDFDWLLTSSSQFTRNLLKTLSMRLRRSNISLIDQLQHNLITANTQLEKMHKIIEATKIVNSSIDVDTLLELILQTATTVVSADRGTLYLIDNAKEELWSKTLQGSEHVEIRMPLRKGIAGYVGATGETINIPDAYADSRFNPEIDRATGYRTKTILCMPMKNKAGTIIGVFQILNKRDGIFSGEDEELLSAFSVHASMALENAQLARQIVQHERLSAVGRMANTIIHDIKNPMGIIRLSAQIIKRKSTDPETGKLANDIMQQIDRFVTMTQEILDFSRGVSAMNIQETEVNQLFSLVLTLIKTELTQHNIQIVENLQFTDTALLDPEKMTRVFYNLIGNSADAMPKGGTLTITSTQRDDKLVIDFTDTGIGMPPEVKAKIFEPFVTHGKRHGTGLGMAIVKKIMDDHNGQIEIDTIVGKGTTVRLILPLK
jgi:signal transduction histidine kinase/CRP-like cAMP-binding protein